MTVIFVSTGVSTGLMVDKMMKVAPGGLVVPLLPKQTQLQVQNPRLDVDYGVFIALRDNLKKKQSLGPQGTHYPPVLFFLFFWYFPSRRGFGGILQPSQPPKPKFGGWWFFGCASPNPGLGFE